MTIDEFGEIEMRSKKEKEFRDTWFTSWKLFFGNDWVISDQMWELKDNIQQHLGNRYSLNDGRRDGYIDEKIDGYETMYRLINWS